MKNLSLKIFSLIVAALLAYYVHSDTNEGVIGLSVPVELKGLPADRVVIYPLARQVQVSIKGPSFLLSQIYASPPSFRVKLPEDLGNRFVAILNKKDLTLPPTIQVMRVEPSEIEFKFDKLIKKTVPVQVTQIGTVPEGFKITEITAEPKELVVTGPQTELMTIKRVETEPIDLREMNTDTERDVTLRFMMQQSELSATVVKVKVKVLSTHKKIEIEEATAVPEKTAKPKPVGNKK